MERRYKYLVKAIAKMPKHDMGNGYYVQVSYDTSDDTVLSDWHVSLGFNEWCQYHSPSIIFVGNYTKKISKKELIEHIEEAIRNEKFICEECLENGTLELKETEEK